MPVVIAPIIAWFAGLSTEATIGWTLFGLGATGIAANTYRETKYQPK